MATQTAVCYYDYENIQTPISVSVGGVLEGQFINIPKAESEGVELEGVWTPVRDLIFTLSYSYDYTAFLTGCSGTRHHRWRADQRRRARPAWSIPRIR